MNPVDSIFATHRLRGVGSLSDPPTNDRVEAADLPGDDGESGVSFGKGAWSNPSRRADSDEDGPTRRCGSTRPPSWFEEPYAEHRGGVRPWGRDNARRAGPSTTARRGGNWCVSVELGASGIQFHCADWPNFDVSLRPFAGVRGKHLRSGGSCLSAMGETRRRGRQCPGAQHQLMVACEAVHPLHKPDHVSLASFGGIPHEQGVVRRIEETLVGGYGRLHELGGD